MAIDKVSFLLVLVLAVIGLKHGVVAQQDFDDVDPQWPVGDISPLDSLAYWDSQAPPDVEETQEAQGCCLPKTWTSNMFEEVKRDGRRPVSLAETCYVDQNSQRIALDVTILRGPKRNATKISYIVLFNKNSSATLYTFSKAASKCKTKLLKNVKFQPMCLPKNSTLLANFSLGAGAGALKTQTWGYLIRDRRATTAGSVVLTPDNCVPILAAKKVFPRPKMSDAGVDGGGKRSKVTTVGTLFTNFVTQVRDKSVFTPPSYCKGDAGTLFFDPDIDFITIIQRFVTVSE